MCGRTIASGQLGELVRSWADCSTRRHASAAQCLQGVTKPYNKQDRRPAALVCNTRPHNGLCTCKCTRAKTLIPAVGKAHRKRHAVAPWGPIGREAVVGGCACLRRGHACSGVKASVCWAVKLRGVLSCRELLCLLAKQEGVKTQLKDPQ